jgi:hypothetical protein
VPQAGIAAERGRLRGYLTPQGTGEARVTVHLPFGVAPQRVAAWVGGRLVARSAFGTTVSFVVRARNGRAIDWALTWSV